MKIRVAVQMQPGPNARIDVTAATTTEAVIRAALRAESMYSRKAVRIIALKKLKGD